MKNEYRIGECEHTKHEVLQVRDGAEWLCLHKETREEELLEIVIFLEKQNENQTRQVR